MQLNDQQRRWVEETIPKIQALARALAPMMPHASVAELESAGYEGLVEAALRYEPDLGVPFAAYAHYRSRGAMIDAARRAAPELRRRSRAMRALEATQALFEQAQKRSPKPNSVERRTLEERVQTAADLVAQATTAVLLTKLAPTEPDTVLVGTASTTAETVLLEREQNDQLTYALHGCTAEENAIVDGLYTRGLTMQEFADESGHSKSTVSRHHAKLLGELGRRMRERPWMKDS